MSERTIVTRVTAIYLLQAVLLPSLAAVAADVSLPDAKSSLAALDAQGNAVSLPTPPDSLVRLIETGNVAFEFYDAAVTKRTFAGETRFTFNYSYDSRIRWKRVRQQGQDAIQISVRYQNIALQRTHRILLPQTLLGPTLFERSLTLHEFDHVAISCDERLPAALEAMLIHRNTIMVRMLDEFKGESSGAVSADELSRISRRLVKEASDRVFNDFVALVSIRYRELDRVSDSGLKPLTAKDRQRIVDSPLVEP